MSEHTPSHDIDAEMSVLSAMMLSSNAIDSVQEHLRSSDFYRKNTLGVIYDVMCGMHDRQEPVEAVTVASELERLGKLEAVGGRGKVHEVAAWASAAGNASHYAKIVKEHAILRGLATAGMEIAKLAREGGTVDERLHQAEVALSDVTLSNRSNRATSIADGFDAYVDEVRETVLSGIPRTGLLTGYPSLDKITMGFWPGQFIVIGARPGQGKSTLGLNICENLADLKVPSLFVSLEMSKPELQERGLARAARVDSYNLRDGKVTAPEQLRMKDGINKVKARDGILFVDDDGYITLPALKAEAVRLARTAGIELLVVDYLQLMTPPKAETRNLEIGEISRGLKLLAKRLNIPIVAIAQMSRAIETRGGADRRPQLSDLRDSGSLEQDADVVIFLHDQSNYDLDKEPDGSIEVIVAKNRKGITDTAKLGYVRKFSSFMDFDKREEAADAA